MNMFVANHAETTKFSNLGRAAAGALTREWRTHISRLEQETTNVSFSLAQETTDGDILGEVRHWTQPPDKASSWSEHMEKLTVSFVSAVENLCLQKKLHLIEQSLEENATVYILRFLSEGKLAYATAWAMGEDGNVVSFLKGFTDRAFAGHLLRTGRANTLGRGGPGEGGSTGKRTPGDGRGTHGGGCGADGFLPILETVQ